MRQMHESRPWKATIENCFTLLRGGCAANLPMWSLVQSGVVESREMFSRVSTSMVVCKREHFPVDPDLKYIQIILDQQRREGRVAVEITGLDFVRLDEQLRELRLGFELKGRKIFFQDKPLLNTQTRHHFHVKGVDIERSRTLVTTIGWLAGVNSDAVGDFFDIVWGFNLCKQDCRPQLEDPVEQEQYQRQKNATSTGEDRMQMKQTMSLQLEQKMEMCMQLDQRPLLMNAQVMTQRLIAHAAQRGKMLKMNGDELREYVQNEASANPAFHDGS